MIRPQPEVYPSNSECIVVLFDFRDAEAVEMFHHLRAVWQEDSDIEALDADHFALLLWPGGAAWRLAA
jgi:hypothetical protein